MRSMVQWTSVLSYVPTSACVGHRPFGMGRNSGIGHYVEMGLTQFLNQNSGLMGLNLARLIHSWMILIQAQRNQIM